MRKRCELTVYTLAIALCCCVARGSTLTFDEVPSGTSLLLSSYYMHHFRVDFTCPFEAADHTASTWGPPRSGTNVLAWESSGSYLSLGGRINFGYLTSTTVDWDEVRSVGAYFSTDLGAMVRVTARTYGAEVASVVIGAPGESWDNRYVEIAAPPGSSFCQLFIYGVNSEQELMSFCMDDMMVTYVPEPSSLLALSAGLVSAGALLRRRRR